MTKPWRCHKSLVDRSIEIEHVVICGDKAEKTNTVMRLNNSSKPRLNVQFFHSFSFENTVQGMKSQLAEDWIQIVKS